MKRWISVLALFALLSLLALPARQARAADFVDVTVRIKCVEQVENPDTASGDGDYFPEVKIGDHDFSIQPTSSGPLGAGPIEDDTFCPDWRFTRNVDRTGPIDIVIRLKDSDGDLNFDTDLMDISPVNNKVELFIRFNAFTGTWASADSEVNGNIARGDGDHGFPEANDGRIAQIEFDVFVGTNSDIDGDGIPDAIENNGVRRSDGSLVADLKALGADPCRKTIVVRIDYMTGAADGHSHEPKAAAIQQVVTAFDQAPVNAVTCPYTGTHKAKGIDFIYMKGASIMEQAIMALDDGFRAARAANFPAELRPYAHYAIFVHDQASGSSSSGLCCESTQGNKDFIVSLGSWRSACVGPGANGTLETGTQDDDVVVGAAIDVGPDLTCDTPRNVASDDVQLLAVNSGASDARVGAANDQAGTIMHELGHALGLAHGGDETTNFMPNYIGAMNYAFQFGIPRGPTPPGAAAPPTVLDYSSAKLADLDKSKLKESAGVGSSLTDWTRWTDASGAVRWGSAAGGIDWDWNGAIDNGSVDCGDGISKNCVSVNINADDDSGAPQTVLTGFDDWQNLKYRAVESPSAGASNAAPHPTIPDVNFPTALREQTTFLASFDPNLAATKVVDKADAQGGDTLNYTVTVANVGTGPTINTSVTDTFPVGQAKRPETRQIGAIYPGARKTEVFKLTVACSTADGTALVNSAAASGTDMGGGAEADLTNNTSSASTTVHAPKLKVAKTASGAGLAGEALTFNVVVSNTGSGTATNVEVKDILPADVYYSVALDQGTGPKPVSVVRNGDGTTTLTWKLGSLTGAGAQELKYTARPSLLFLGGESLTNVVEVTYQNANGCTFVPERATASTTITVVPPTRDPLTHGFWRNHPELWSTELLARIQATDQRFDTDNNGELSSAEVTAVLAPNGNMDRILLQQLNATYFNLATRRINAATALDPKAKLVQQLSLSNVRDAALYARGTLALPLSSATRDRYSNATIVLDGINNNKITLY
jgi:uncharacterized repeat protein (TIGR01451 family)